ncbi:COG3173 Predicted aminoglycoside phosphotransferase [actinobacterium SCGC AAA044-D11]
MEKELLNETTVVAYLTNRGIISGPAEVEELTGGVSNVVLAVKAGAKDLVLKQALPQLKVAAVWKADQRRAIVEANGMKLLHSITPTSVPELIDFDPEDFTLTMERLPRECTVWKSDLLSGVIKPNIGADLGRILATWHNFGADSKESRDAYMEDSLFDQLRVTPFYRAVAKVNPTLDARIQELITEISTLKISLVHGDFSPKNIMITGVNKPIVLDFEVMHTGNPVFDLGFVAAHLLCKYLRTEDPAHKNPLRETALVFIDSYARACNIEVAKSLPHHVAVIALARVEGVSPVNYLDEAGKARVQSVTKAALANPQITFEGLFA